MSIEDSTVHAVFYLIVMHWVWMSNFWRSLEPKNPVKACKYIHSDRIFLQHSGLGKKLKNEDSTVHAVFYLIVMHWVRMSNFWRLPEPENPAKACQYIHGDRVFFTTLWASQKNLKNEDSTAHAVFYLIVMHRVQMSNFWRTPELKNPVKASWYIHSDRSFFIRLWTGQKIKKCSIYCLCSVLPTSNAPEPNFQFFEVYQCSKTRWRPVDISIVTDHFLQGSVPPKK